MKKIENIDNLPKPLRVLARSFITMDVHSPEILEARADEMSKLRYEEEVVFQLVLDREWMKWYLVAVGDQERQRKSDLIIHNPYTVKRSILVFAPVDDAWIRSKRHEYESHMIDKDNARVWDGNRFDLEPIAAVDFTPDIEDLI